MHLPPPAHSDHSGQFSVYLCIYVDVDSHARLIQTLVNINYMCYKISSLSIHYNFQFLWTEPKNCKYYPAQQVVAE